ncbi:MAG: hypothetical protein IM638_02685 [Bacteroidetes bacterium]|nr:hypothetical protein [Bacteroidota bacterium]
MDILDNEELPSMKGVLVTIGTIIIVFAILNYFDQNKKGYKFTSAYVYDIRSGPRMNKTVYYTFIVNGSRIEADMIVTGSYSKNIINNSAPILVAYSPNNLNDNYLLVDQNMYHKFDLSPPDSVKWIFK